MIYRALDDNGDMTIGNQNAYISASDAVRQACVTRLRQLIYEWWEDVTDGVPYWQEIVGTRDIATAKRLIRERIQNTDRVVSILSFDADWDNERRVLTIRATIQSEYGEFTLEEGL